MFAKTALMSAFIAFVASSAQAENYQIIESVEQSAVSSVGRPVDILGITPGMPEPDASAILGKEFGGADRVMVYQMRVSSVTQELQSQRFTSFVEAENGLRTDLGQIHLTSPISGNRVYAFYRRTQFRLQDGLPKINAVKAKLVEKYGEPTRTQGNVMAWYLGGSGKCEGSKLCFDLHDGGGQGGELGYYDLSQTATYEKALASGTKIVIIAKLETRRDIPDGIQALHVSFVDLNLLAKSARADVDLAAQKQAEFNKTGASVPKL
jgi:hypothetical protein